MVVPGEMLKRGGSQDGGMSLCWGRNLCAKVKFLSASPGSAYTNRGFGCIILKY